ncbi:hypothetical protein P3S68_004490 [Capsicum galapagoense]
MKLQLSESGCPSCWYRTSARKIPRVCCKDLSSTTAPHDVGSSSDIRKISDCLGAELLSETVTTFWFYCHTLFLFAQSSLQALTT